MTGKEIRSRACEQVARAYPLADLSEIQDKATVIVNDFAHWLETGETVRPPKPAAPPPPK
jgi:hypothetical protein